MAKNRLKVREKNGIIDVKVIIAHKMETGLRKDKEGKVIPAHHLTSVTVSNNGAEVITSNIGAAVSENPYFRFNVKGKSGDEIVVAFADNKGESGSISAKV